MNVDLIAFDGDDTLWHNERSFRSGRERFFRLLADAGVALDADEIDAHVNRIEQEGQLEVRTGETVADDEVATAHFGLQETEMPIHLAMDAAIASCRPS